MIDSVKRAASETAGTGLRFIAISLVAMVGLSLFSDFQRWRETVVDIYAPPTDIIWSVRPDSLVVSAVSEKKEACDVIFDSPVFLLALVEHDTGLEPVGYPAIKVSGRELRGRPLLQTGDRFLVGPWVIKDSKEMLDRIGEVRVVLQCEFVSGTRRSTFIGPIKRPET